MLDRSLDSSLDRLFLPNGHPKKYKGPRLPPHFDVLFQLASGLEYLHSQRCLHGNISPENVFISVDSNNGPQVVTMKWANFGQSSMSVYDRAGLNWLAPELLHQERRANNDGIRSEHPLEGLTRSSITEKSDVFAEGLVFSYFLSGDGVHPYGRGDEEIQANIRTGNRINAVSSRLRY